MLSMRYVPISSIFYEDKGNKENRVKVKLKIYKILSIIQKYPIVTNCLRPKFKFLSKMNNWDVDIKA